MIAKIGFLTMLLLVTSQIYVYAETGSFLLNFEGSQIDIGYDADGVQVLGIELDMDFVSLIISVDVTDSLGILVITFDRAFFDSIYQGSDDDFIIVADGDEPNFQEISTTSQSRTLRIELIPGTEEVEIIGTQFGTPEPEVMEEEVMEEEVMEEEVMEEEVMEEEVMEEEVMEEEVMEEEPTTICGPGTVLQDGICMLDEKCGPGTILEDGVCVLVESGGRMFSGLSNFDELVFGAGAALVIAFIVILVLFALGRATR